MYYTLYTYQYHRIATVIMIVVALYKRRAEPTTGLIARLRDESMSPREEHNIT